MFGGDSIAVIVIVSRFKISTEPEYPLLVSPPIIYKSFFISFNATDTAYRGVDNEGYPEQDHRRDDTVYPQIRDKLDTVHPAVDPRDADSNSHDEVYPEMT